MRMSPISSGRPVYSAMVFMANTTARLLLVHFEKYVSACHQMTGGTCCLSLQVPQQQPNNWKSWRISHFLMTYFRFTSSDLFRPTPVLSSLSHFSWYCLKERDTTQLPVQVMDMASPNVLIASCSEYDPKELVKRMLSVLFKKYFCKVSIVSNPVNLWNTSSTSSEHVFLSGYAPPIYWFSLALACDIFI